MKRFLSLVLLFVTVLLYSQEKSVYLPQSFDPSFRYIEKYMPEYYYERHVLNPGMVTYSVELRIMKNHVDDKTFPYLVFHGSSSATLYVGEIESLVRYLERVERLMHEPKWPKVECVYNYNSISGLLFKTSLVRSKIVYCLYSLYVIFPDNSHISFSKAKEVSQLILFIKKAYSLLPEPETLFCSPSIDSVEENKYDKRELSENNLTEI